MIPILTPQQMKSADELAIRHMGIPSLYLMENAGRSAVEVLQGRIKSLKKRSVVIFCGKGNNGGDGFVIARILNDLGGSVSAVVIEPDAALSGDARMNFERLNRSIVSSFDRFKSLKQAGPEIIVDAMFGTSFKGELKDGYLDAVRWCNGQKAFKVAIDIPSGLDGETGDVISDAFRADLTIAFSNPKLGFYRRNAKEYTGEVVVTDIGIPPGAVEKNSGSSFLVEPSDLRALIPKRRSNSHKHSVGKIFFLAGSRGMTGAALLASQSAMRSGAGQVILGIPESEYAVVARRTLEVIPFPLASTQEGSISTAAKSDIDKKIAWADIIVIGCGMSQNPETQDLIRQVIRDTGKPMIIDADGLNALAGDLSLLKRKKPGEVILTPHGGEFSRLTGMTASEIESKKFESAPAFAKEFTVTLVLKGAPTVIANSQGDVFVNPTGNPGMSTAGAGDVLAGITASMYGQRMSAAGAAVAAVFIHGLAGDVAATKKGAMSMIASDIIKQLPTALKKVQ